MQSLKRSGLIPLVLLILVCSCAPRGLRLAPWAPPTQGLNPPANGWPDEPAVYLFRRDRSRFDFHETWHHRHEALKVLSEAGRGFGEVKLRIPIKARLREIQARAISSDGEVRWLDPKKLIRDTTETTQGDYRIVIFAFPDVQVGSVLELQYVVHEFEPSAWEVRVISDRVPTKQYEVVLEAARQFEVEMRSVGAGQSWQKLSNAPRGYQAQQLVVNDVGKWRSEPFSPGPLLVEPFWVFVIRKAGVTPVVSEWKEAVKAESDVLYREAGRFSRDANLPTLKCVVGECLDVALKWVHKLRFNGFGGFPGRSAKKVISAGEATGLEKGRLLYHLLREKDIEVQFGLTPPVFGFLGRSKFSRSEGGGSCCPAC